MDAVKFLREYRRMCNNYLGCDSCPVAVMLGHTCKHALNENYGELVVEIVENWSIENPEEIGKKYIIEISMILDNGLYRIKGTECWLNREEFEQLEEYKGSEE